MNREKHALVALGSNLRFGEIAPEDTIRSAVLALSEAGLPAQKVSPLYRTPCFPKGAGPDYVNAAAVLRLGDTLSPAGVLAILHSVEARFGRERVTRWGMRTLDLDLLAVGSLILPDAEGHRVWREMAPERQMSATPDQLILPHPRMQDRAFVLVPLADVAPDWVHPVLGQNVRQMLAALPPDARAEVQLLDQSGV